MSTIYLKIKVPDGAKIKQMDLHWNDAVMTSNVYFTEIELPTEEEIKKEAERNSCLTLSDSSIVFMKGANFILSKMKKEDKP